MPQVRVTPWRYQSELLRARDWFYQHVPDGGLDERRLACDQVVAWRVRGHVPHAVDATASLTDAVLNDDPLRNSLLAIRGAYASAFARFVTGLTDIEQTKRMKVSMFDVATEIGLPNSFVELRHCIIHEELPGIIELRTAVQQALLWLWNNYWKDLPPDERQPEALALLDERAKVLVQQALRLVK